ncbi:DNA repair protein RadC [Hydrogenivirga caldilitoris]|uniref:DNA repair protein RadC n=1 Tax=Hydrogenivirga caldilitoris TaxID=246264 RepID=A0A497XTZ5_9AQUI|nr:DNA repair protein RadC [Hydrogenivirga caldilitoris]RLJ70393.1 DNA repair protein RadC [Hydrogenivirga caldilitoris]
MRYRYRSIKEIPQEYRPREKLRKHGAQSLSDEELLAVIFGAGSQGMDVLTLARNVLKQGWKRLEEVEFSELTKLKGLGLVKAAQIKALIELSKRIREPMGSVQVLSPEDAYRLLRGYFDNRKEVLVALYLDVSHRVRHIETVAIGSVNRVYADPKEILRPAVELSAYGILVAHNHPQGNPEPSKEDLLFTERVSKACEILGFELVDHIIFSPEGYLSFREKGLLD